MKEVNCIIIEDQLPAQEILKSYIDQVVELKLQATFTNAIEAGSWLKQNSTDLIFLDIHLPKVTGLEFLEMMTVKPKVILTTAYTEYALEGFELDVVDYLVKPFSFDRFNRALGKLNLTEPGDYSTTSDPGEEDFVFVKDGHEILKIFYHDILYLKASGDFVEVVIKDRKHLISSTLKYWEELLPNKGFYRIHKSYIVNLKKIDKISGNQVILPNQAIPIGRSYQQAFLKKLDLKS